jgi:hypothetical protein
MVSVLPANDPFAGGSRTPNVPPPSVSGSITPASTAVINPVAGASVNLPFYARQNKGSNIGIPYTRLCPLGDSRDLVGLPSVPGFEAFDATGRRTDKARVTETEHLSANRVCFILGHRSGQSVGMVGSTVGQLTNIANDPTVATPNPPPPRGFNDDPGRMEESLQRNYGHSLAIHRSMAPGLPGVERFQKLCSFEYLQRYFYHVLAHKGVNLCKPINDHTVIEKLNNGVANNPFDIAQKQRVNEDEYNRLGGGGNFDDVRKGITLNDGRNSSLVDMLDIARLAGLPSSEAQGAKSLKQGIFTADTGPFLRGKGRSQRNVSLIPGQGNSRLPFVKKIGAYTFVQNQTHMSRGAGDQYAFGILERILENIGIMDWKPDGIVLSKGTDDPSDALNDEYLKARDGELFNVRVQGPAIASTWSGDAGLEMLPLDRVFVLVVADVYSSTDYNRASSEANINAYLDAIAPNGTDLGQIPTKTQRDAYDAKRNELFERDKLLPQADLGNFEAAQQQTFRSSRMTNFRVMLATSSQMHAYSQLSFDSSGKQRVDMDIKSTGSRMGLKLAKSVIDSGNTFVYGEYVVGGWCIGKCMDSAASRGSFPSKSIMGVRTAPNTAAINLNVDIQYMSGDDLFNAHMNIDDTIQTRVAHTPNKTKSSVINKSPDDEEDFPTLESTTNDNIFAIK